MHIAAEFGHVNFIEKLHTFEADLNAKNGHGSTPLFIAAAKGTCYNNIMGVWLLHYKDGKFREMCKRILVSV